MELKIKHSYNNNGDIINDNYKPSIPQLEELLNRVINRINQGAQNNIEYQNIPQKT